MLRQRPDRVFFAGESPGAPGTDYLWIIDYKTAALPAGVDRDSFLAAAANNTAANWSRTANSSASFLSWTMQQPSASIGWPSITPCCPGSTGGQLN